MASACGSATSGKGSANCEPAFQWLSSALYSKRCSCSPAARWHGEYLSAGALEREEVDVGRGGWLSRPARRIGCLQPGQGVGRLGGSEASKSRMLVSTRNRAIKFRGRFFTICRPLRVGDLEMNDSLSSDARSCRSGEALPACSEFLRLYPRRAGSHRKALGFRKGGIPRQPDPHALQGTPFRLSLALLPGTLLPRSPLRVSCRLWSFVGRPGRRTAYASTR